MKRHLLPVLGLLAILCIGCSPETPDGANPPPTGSQPTKAKQKQFSQELQQKCSVLQLTMGEHQGNARMEPGGSLVFSNRITRFLREMTRQAVLIAARDELGLTTRDEMLGESASGNEVRSLVLDFSVGTYPRFEDANVEFHPSDVQFRRDQYHKNHTPPYASVPLIFMIHTNLYQGKIKEIEQLSRAGFKDTLKNLNLEAKNEVRPRSETPLPESVRNLLLDLNPVSQFEAVRTLHRLIRENGESLPLLKGLVLGYAQLYLLTEHFMTAESRVFQCRSILYAERALALYGKSAETVALKGAALSLTTCFRLARGVYDDLEEIEKDGDGKQTVFDGENAWLNVARPMSRFDFEGVWKCTNDPQWGNLAKLVVFVMYDYSDAWLLTRRQGQWLSKDFSCVRIYDGMMRARTFENVDIDGIPYQQIYENAAAERVAKIEALPEPVVEALKEREKTATKKISMWDFSDRYAVPFTNLLFYQSALAKTTLADDPGEMSLQALARLLREEAFTQIDLTSRHITGRNGDPDPFFETIEPLLEGHPLKIALFQRFRDKDKRDRITTPLKDMKIPYPLIEVNARELWQRIPGKYITENRIVPPGALARISSDPEVYRDSFWLFMAHGANPMAAFDGGTLEPGRRLSFTAPDSPLALRAWIQGRWRFNDADIERWMPRIREFHYIGTSIIDRLTYGDDVELQEKIWKMMAENGYDYYTASHLGSFYRQHGRSDEAIKVMEEYLTCPDASGGLNHASASAFLARLHMEEKRFEKALPHAMAAAQSHSSWGLTTLADAYEALGEFDKAENMHRQNMRSYSGGIGPPLRWCRFCQRTNRSSLAKAVGEVEQIWDRDKVGMRNLEDYAYFFRMRQVDFPKELPPTPDIYYHFYYQNEGVARLALTDLLAEGDLAKTLEFLPLLRKEWPRQAPLRNKSKTLTHEWVMWMNMVEPELRDGGPAGRFDEKEIDYLLQITKQRWAEDLSVQRYCYLLGRYYDLAGNRAKAMEFYKKCVAQTDSIHNFNRNFALNELRKDGFTNEDYLALMNDKSMIVPHKPFPRGTLNRFCTLVFRDYSENPSSRLKPGPKEKTNVDDPHFLHSHDSIFEKGIYYKVVGGRLGDEKFGPDQSMLRIRIRQGWLQFLGYGRRITFTFDTTDLSSEPLQVRLIDWGSETTFRGLMTLGGKPTLCLNLDDGGDYPKTLDDPAIPNLIRFELEATDAVP